MDFRLAGIGDLPLLKVVYTDIIDNMNQKNIQIWDEVYPVQFFRGDIENHRLYVLAEKNEIAAAFALSGSNAGEASVKWENGQAQALYLDRFGVNVNYLRKGIGSFMLDKAVSLAGEKGIPYVRLFVVDINQPAIKLYQKNGFRRMEGIYEEKIDGGLVLRQFGFERKTIV